MNDDSCNRPSGPYASGGGTKTALSGYRILLVDDDADARKLVSITLSHLGHEIVTCANAADAIESCRKQMPDLALIDIQLPVTPGTEICKWIKQNCHGTFVPVVFLTCQSDVSDRVLGLQLGADDYITKPFDCQELNARVKALLRIKSLTDELRSTQSELQQKERKLLAQEVLSNTAELLGQPLSSIFLEVDMLRPFALAHPELAHHISNLGEECMRIRELLRQLYANVAKDSLPPAWRAEWKEQEENKTRDTSSFS